ncbi:hypothetical protein DEO72_LG1g1842 [Vigna unguiculata]|uniref:Uncharacterized protein n=1 Tax=Vigna unguiculata TaxID=3917 RepID=A0A4D6KNG8_VIGUN|nr:hypothetical protein DEO72_LG1g1842 [Vigna unguiculata]
MMVGRRRRRYSGAGNLLCSGGAGDTKGWHAMEEWTRCAALKEEEEVQNVCCFGVKRFGFF